jgi:hypothetical protein
MQFGDNGPDLGFGDPTWLFTGQDAAEGVREGWGATADVINPFGSPWADMGYYNPCASWVPVTQNLTRGGLGALFTAGSIYMLAPQGLSAGATQTVTHWGPEGMSSLRPGDWVMTGGPTIRNWIMAGVPGIYRIGNYITQDVPASALRYPPGWEWIKGLLGQRVYYP